MTTARPILFSAPMVRALLEGRKTQTRRLMKRQPAEHHWRSFKSYRVDARLLRTTKGMAVRYLHSFAEFGADNSELEDAVSIPYGVPGDLLWVRETWANTWDMFDSDEPPPSWMKTSYRADHPEIDGGWRPSIHMPRARSRLTLEITGVKVERLQDISKADVIAEGITERDGCPIDDVVSGWHEPYAQLWDKLNGPGAWDANPWIVALSFTAHKSNVDTYLSQRAEAA